MRGAAGWMAAGVLAALAGIAACESTGPLMKPGDNCISCHDGGGTAPRWRLAGTVYECGTAGKGEGVAGVEVVVTDADGVEALRLVSNEAGNFYTGRGLPDGYRVRLERAGTVREMIAAPPVGACNSCHRVPAKNGTTGRLYVGSAECGPDLPEGSAE